jgi:hypothetical protein
MDTKTIDVQAVTIELNELLNLLQSYPEIVLMQGDKPVARISAVEESKPEEKRERIPGLHQG